MNKYRYTNTKTADSDKDNGSDACKRLRTFVSALKQTTGELAK